LKQAPPARSTETQQLMDLCYQVAAGQNGQYSQLESLATARKLQVQQNSQGFFAELEAESEEFHSKFQAQLDLIERMFEGYGAALDDILSYRTEPKPEKLQEAAFALSLASHGLATAMIAYQQAYLSQGASLYPIVNLFSNLAPLYRQGQASPDDWKNTCYQYTGFYLGALQEIEKSPHQSDPGVPERRAALISVMQAIEALHELTPASTSASFEEATARLSSSLDELAAAVKTFNDAAVAGPTASRGVNTVLMTLRLNLESGVQREVLQNACEVQLGDVQKVIAEVQAAAKLPNESAVVREEGAKMLQALETMEESLEMLLAFAESEDGLAEAAREAAKMLESATNEVHAATQSIQEANDRYGKISCPACGHYNPPSNKNCVSCGRLLPQMTGSEEYGSWAQKQSAISERPEDQEGPIMTDVMQDLLESCEAYEKGKLEKQVLLDKIARLEASTGTAQNHIDHLRTPVIPDEIEDDERERLESIQEMVLAAVGLFAEGIESCEFGLAKMRQGIEGDSREEVVEGLQAYFAGCQNMWQVELFHRKYQKLQEESERLSASEVEDEQSDPNDDLA
jgi:hypothetical protein